MALCVQLMRSHGPQSTKRGGHCPLSRPPSLHQTFKQPASQSNHCSPCPDHRWGHSMAGVVSQSPTRRYSCARAATVAINTFVRASPLVLRTLQRFHAGVDSCSIPLVRPVSGAPPRGQVWLPSLSAVLAAARSGHLKEMLHGCILGSLRRNSGDARSFLLEVLPLGLAAPFGRLWWSLLGISRVLTATFSRRRSRRTLLSGFPGLAFLPLILASQSLGLELVPVAFDLLQSVLQGAISITYLAPRGLSDKEKTYSTTCRGAGASVVK